VRERLLWGVIAVLIIVIAILIFFNDTTSNDIARIENKTIGEQQFVDELVKRYGSQLLYETIEREAIFYEANRLAVEVADRDVDKEIERYKHNLADDDRDLETVIFNDYGISLDQLRNDIRYNLLLEKLATLDVRVSDAEIEKYYQENQEQFNEKEKLRIRRILLKEQAEAEQASKELQEGAVFAALAMEISQDRLTASNGGNIGLVQVDSLYLDPELINMASSLDVGQVSKPFETSEGWNIIMLEERIEEKLYQLAEVKPLIFREMALKQAKPLNEYLQDLIMKLDIEIYEENIKGNLNFEP
jgi:foldase protein PrsA